VLVIAAVVTVIELLMSAYFYDLYRVLGIFIPLIVTNCAIIGRAEGFACKNSVVRSLIDALAMGIGFTLVLVVLGGMRELVGQGTLFAHAELMFGDWGRQLNVTVLSDYRGFLVAVLPPGAFLGLGLLIAIKNVVDRKLNRARSAQVVVTEPVVASAG